jgi:hypothetical protein
MIREMEDEPPFLFHDADWCGVGAAGHRQAFFPPLFSERQCASTDGTQV